MPAPTNYYVDPDPLVGVDVATGGTTPADPYLSVQFGVDDITTSHGGRDAVNGDQINVVEGTDDTPAADLDLATVGAVYGAPAVDAPLVIRGCARDPITGLPVANNGGVGGMDGGAGGFSIFDGVAGGWNYINFIDMHLHNTGAVGVVRMQNDSNVIGCEVDTCGAAPCLRGASRSVFANNYLHDGGSIMCQADDGTIIWGNYIDATVVSAIRLGATNNTVERNILICAAVAVMGVDISSPQNRVIGNSIYNTAAGTNAGINLDANTHSNLWIADNLIEGFSGVGGSAYDFGTSLRHIPMFVNNSYYNCTAEILAGTDCDKDYEDGNELLTASPFLKEGAMSYTNRFNYFKSAIPVRGGAFPPGCRFDRGAVQVRLAVERTIAATVVTSIPARIVLDPVTE